MKLAYVPFVSYKSPVSFDGAEHVIPIYFSKKKMIEHQGKDIKYMVFRITEKK